MKKATITDVAKKAGVSIATVSYVINQTKSVRPETERRVLDAVKELHYSPDLLAQSLKSGSKKIVAFMVPNLANAYYASLANAAAEVLMEEGYQLMVSSCHTNPKEELEKLAALPFDFLEGIVIAPVNSNFKDLQRHIPSSIPMMVTDQIPEGTSSDTVWISTYQATYDSVRYLIQKGHGKIGILGGPLSANTNQERYNAYCDALKDSGSIPSPDLIKFPQQPQGFHVPGLFQELIDQNCSSIIIGGSRMALECSNRIIREFPHIEFVITIDSPEYKNLFSDFNAIELPTEQMGRIAGRQMLQRIQNRDSYIREQILNASFNAKYTEKTLSI